MLNTSRIDLPKEDWAPGEFPSILAIGDSWFWYSRNNLLQALVEHKRLKDRFRFIQILSYNGARLEQYVFGRYARQLDKHLSSGFRSAYSAILISGAGNVGHHETFAQAAEVGLVQRRDLETHFEKPAEQDVVVELLAELPIEYSAINN